MSDVYFVQTRTMLEPNMYDGYRDYFRLAALSGYATCYINEVDPDSDNTYIITPLNGEWNHGWSGTPKAQIILHDLEWRLKESDYQWSESDLTIPPGVARVWASDRWYAQRIKAEYVPLGSHPGLVGDATTDQAFDVAPLAYRTGRRNAAFGQMERSGLTLAPNSWGEARDAALKASHVVAHVHQHDNVPTVAPLRFAIAAAWHKPLISEQVHDRGLFEDSVLYADYSVLADYTALMVRRYPELLRQTADALHDTLCVSNSFRSFVEAAL
jgi:hypothetical protein